MDGLQDQEMPSGDDEEEKDSDGEGSSESSSSSSEEDPLSDDEGESQALLVNLEASLAQNPYNFQEHVAYIQVLRKASMLDRLREARERMSSIFPLTSEMWQMWANDEAHLISSQEDVAAVRQLFERGLQEYLSVPLWLDYLEFNLNNDQDIIQCNETGVTKMRNLYEQALTASSLHFMEGTKVWAAYRQYEMSLLSDKQDNLEEARTKQINSIRNVYRRQLSVPSWDVPVTLKDYIIWESQQGVQIGDESDDLAALPANIAFAYRKAVQMCSSREPFEEKVSKEKPKDADLLQNFLSYIALEEETGDPARVQVLYERAIAEFPITHDLWLKYTIYLEQNLKGSTIIPSVYGRATRNCPWNQALWSRYLLALERSNASEIEMAKVFEQSLHSGFAFSTAEEYLDHFLTRVDGLRRRMCGGQLDKSLYLGTLRETFTQAVEILSTFFPTFVDRSLRLHSYWARLEHSLANDIAAARGVWENLIKSSGWMLEVWKGFISMEVSLGNLAEARTLYRRCYTRKFEGKGSEVLCESWLHFEREYGSLEDYDRALLKVTPRLAEVKKLQQQQDAKLVAATSCEVKGADDKFGKSASTLGSGQKKRHLQDTDTFKENKSRKRHKVTTANNAEETKESAQTDTKEGKVETADADGGPDTQTKLDSKERQWYNDQCTVFVSRLAPEVNEEDLHGLFKHCNNLREIRLMKDRKTGASRRFAYVDFENEEGLTAALKLDNQKLKGSKIKVLRSDPAWGGKKGASRQQGLHASGNDERNDRSMEKDIGEGPTEKRQSNFGGGRGRGGRSSGALVSHRRGGHVQLTGKNTFAAPRSIARPLGFSQKGQVEGMKPDEPKSNEDFRKMLSKE
ncbi:hypothetical protein GOP47_0014866 [Adiantum capillus-veneris]|uniref:RRM domain-containing protein n=1 Tax=Adiantum capillus-veneris TaxID=13818 RepID=A0A9D4ZCK3_ADICA|nr:hypothetical protein GOP47_0014866 [Adiantum capillus-veneris]